jgi:hypothetical protein
MNVGELRAALADLPADMLVILQKDSEGNGYSPLSDAEDGLYEAESTWSGEVYPTPAELAKLIAHGNGWTEDDAAPDTAIACIVLAPVN